jgi:uncharacterized OsmC-like protein
VIPLLVFRLNNNLEFLHLRDLEPGELIILMITGTYWEPDMRYCVLVLTVNSIVYSSAMLPSIVRNNLSGRLRLASVFSSSARSSEDSQCKHVKSYKMNGVGEKTMVDITTDTGHSLRTDIPNKMGGSDTAPQPVETLLAAWMGCTQATALFVGRHMPERVLLQKLEFENITAFRDERGALQLPIHEAPDVPSRLQQITGTIRVFSRNEESLSSEQMKLLKEQTEIRCPVANMMLSSGCSIDVEWVNG